MDNKDRKSKNYRKKKYAKNDMKQYVTKSQLDDILDRNVEDKFIDVTEDSVRITSTLGEGDQQIRELTQIPEGDDASSRIGLKIKPKSLALRLYYNGTQTGFNNDTVTRIRCIIFQWHLDAADQPGVDDILALPGSLETDTQAYNNLSNTNKFTIIFNKLVSIQNVDNASNFSDQDSLFREFGPRQRQLYFVSGSADATTGQFYILLISNKESLADAPIVSYYSRFRYEDA